MFTSLAGRASLALGFCLLLMVAAFSATAQPAPGGAHAHAAGPQAEAELPAAEGLANCRYGVVASHGRHVPRLGAGWFLHFNPPTGPKPVAANGAEFVHVFNVFQEKSAGGAYLPGYRTIVPLDEEFAAYVQANPGDLWVIGNEVDRGPNPGEITGGQGDMYPAIYAWAYQEVREFIKRHDPTARTAISGLVQVTPGRLQYLDQMWDAYVERYGLPMPVDVWNMHLYVLPELEPDGLTPNGIANVALGTDPALGKRSSGGDPLACADPDVYCYAEHDDLSIFAEQALAMRRWMKAHGQQQKPLILSEFSILYPYVEEGEGCYLQDEFGGCFTPERVSTYMTHVYDYLNTLQDAELGYGLDNGRLVQQWMWFAMFADSVGASSSLLEADRQTLTLAGETFREAVFAEPPLVNLVTERIPRTVVPADKTGTATVTIAVTLRNNGNVAVAEPFVVTFYEDGARTKEIGSVTVAPPVRGCATNAYSAAIPWPELTPGEYPFWVTVDSADVIAEGPPGQQDNRGSGLVVVHPESAYLPLVSR